MDNQYIGRLDTLQAAVLNVKDLKLRQDVASKYTQALNIETPFVQKDRTSAWAQ